MPEEDGYGGGAGGNFATVREFVGDPDSEDGFQGVEDQRENADPASGGAENIGCADIAATDGTDVAAGGPAHEEIAERDAAQQIGDDENQKVASFS